MSDEHHVWVPEEEPPFIRAHSQAKHRIVAGYLSQYLATLTSNPNIPEFRITLVDGFAGGGRYREERSGRYCEGSPLLMLRAMRDAEAVAQIRRSKPFHLDAQYFFIESSQETFQYLNATIQASEFNTLLADKITLINDAFVNNVDRIIRHIQKRKRGKRAIFVLDQFGYADVPFEAIQAILSNLNNAEIILTFAADSLIDYLSANDLTQQILSSLGLELSKENIRTDKQRADWRFAIQQRLHEEIFKKSGAKYYTPFFIHSKDAHRDYWLIHLSNHSRARDVMVGLHWREHAGFAHYGKPGLAMLGYDPEQDTKLTGQPFLFDISARALTHDSLLIELPERLRIFSDGITFQDLFGKVTNETPATSELINVALNDLRRDGEIQVFDKDGKFTQRAKIHALEIIKPSSQRRLFLPET